MIVRSFTDVFPNSTMWGPLRYPGLYLIGGHRSFEQDPESINMVAKRLSRVEDLKEWDAGYMDEEKLKGLFLLKPRGAFSPCSRCSGTCG